MEQFFEGLGFRIAAHLEIAIALGVLGALAGVILAVRAWEDKDDLGEHRVLAAICGLGLATLLAVGMPVVHRMAERACDRWDRSADQQDRLDYLENRCAELF